MAKKYKKKKPYYESERKWNHKNYWENNYKPSHKALLMIRRMKSLSKRRGFEWSDDWWFVDQITEIIENGYCVMSGIKFTAGFVGQKNGIRDPFKATPDRIDNLKGYEPSNVRWVVYIYNIMKNNFKDEDVQTFVNALKNFA